MAGYTVPWQVWEEEMVGREMRNDSGPHLRVDKCAVDEKNGLDGIIIYLSMFETAVDIERGGFTGHDGKWMVMRTQAVR